jgi:hypothetical protein
MFFVEVSVSSEWRPARVGNTSRVKWTFVGIVTIFSLVKVRTRDVVERIHRTVEI